MDQTLHQVDDIDVENFFNEDDLNAAALNAGILPVPDLTSVPSQAERLVDLISNGSLNQIAWSRPGHVARIVDNGAAVQVAVLRVDPRTSQWTSKTWRMDTTFDDAVGLAWSITGVELTVVDRKGRVHIFVLKQTSAEGLSLYRDGLSDPANEFDFPIGIYCASQARGDKDKKKTVLEVARLNGKWKPEFVEGTAYPPYSVRAVCTMSRRGTFRMLFVRESGSYRTVSLDLPVPSTALFTHAAFAQTSEGKLITALHSTTGEISVYHVNIAFNSNDPLPSLSAETIDVAVPCVPPYLEVDNFSPLNSYNRWLLTHLCVIGESEYSWDHLPHLPAKQPAVLLAVYVSYNEQADAAAASTFAACIIKRWKLEKSSFELHSRFGGSTTNNPADQVTLVPLPDTQLSAPVTNLQALEPGNTIAITTLDGSTTFWDTDRMTQITQDTNSAAIFSVGQVNTDFPLLLMSTVQCISPHGMVLANDNIEEKLIFTKPRYRDLSSASNATPQILDLSSPLTENLIASYVLSFSRSCWMSSSFDDILASIQATVAPPSYPYIRRVMYLTLFQPKTIVPQAQSSELDRTPSSPIVQKVISFNLGLFDLHHPGSTQHEKLAYLWSWLLLNMRWSIAILTDTYRYFQTNSSGQRPPPLTPLFLDTVCANIRWTWSLFTFIFDSLMSISERASHPSFFHPPSFESLLGDADGDGRQGLVALLLNCNWSRTFCLYFARVMKSLTTKSGVHINFAKSPTPTAIPMNSPIGRLASTVQNCMLKHGITIAALEAVFDHKLYPDVWKDDATNQATTEQQVEMMVTGVVGEAYQGSIKKVIETVIDGPEGLRSEGELDRLRMLEECPSRSFLLLNMDDIAFRDHRPTVTSTDEIMSIGSPDGMEDIIKSESAKQENGSGEQQQRSTEKRRTTRDKKYRPTRVLYDTHRKVPIFTSGPPPLASSNPANPNASGQQPTSQPITTSGGALGGPETRPVVTNVDELLAARVRRCVRCGSLSDDESGYQRSWPRLSMQFVAKCVCEGTYIWETVGDGLCLD